MKFFTAYFRGGNFKMGCQCWPFFFINSDRSCRSGHEIWRFVRAINSSSALECSSNRTRSETKLTKRTTIIETIGTSRAASPRGAADRRQKSGWFGSLAARLEAGWRRPYLHGSSRSATFPPLWDETSAPTGTLWALCPHLTPKTRTLIFTHPRCTLVGSCKTGEGPPSQNKLHLLCISLHSNQPLFIINRFTAPHENWNSIHSQSSRLPPSFFPSFFSSIFFCAKPSFFIHSPALLCK